jgi:AraC family transcriptional regulator, melibiose operon regulatory protein
MKPGTTPRKGPTSTHERHFYAANRAFGRFGMRIFNPPLMPQHHWHGHIEANFAVNMALAYDVDGQPVEVPTGRLVIFWAGIPHQMTKSEPLQPDNFSLCNIYLPLDSFLMMHHIAPLQVALLGGGIIALPENLCDEAQVRRWYADYRSGDFERTELVKMEMNALFRRSQLSEPDYLLAPRHDAGTDRALSSTHIRHVIAMVRFALENLDKPLANAQITEVTGLHENYALALFSRIMQMPLKQFVIRMRLMRARALLVESSMAISDVADAAGFASISQFYAQFKAGYGLSPAAVRAQYLNVIPR